MLILGGGHGHEAEFFRNELNLSVINNDYLEIPLARGRALYPNLQMISFDSRYIPLKDNSVDYCFTRASLHHITDPYRAIYEMYRVARKGFGFQEGYDNFFTRTLILLGLALEEEEAGNYIYRFTRREIQKMILALKMKTKRFHFFSWICSPRLMLMKNMFLTKFLVKIINIANFNSGNNLLFWCDYEK
jgi:ubiquinone/menaquinone biosynthesis C-methylase UbiE